MPAYAGLFNPSQALLITDSENQGCLSDSCIAALIMARTGTYLAFLTTSRPPFIRSCTCNTRPTAYRAMTPGTAAINAGLQKLLGWTCRPVPSKLHTFRWTHSATAFSFEIGPTLMDEDPDELQEVYQVRQYFREIAAIEVLEAVAFILLLRAGAFVTQHTHWHLSFESTVSIVLIYFPHYTLPGCISDFEPNNHFPCGHCNRQSAVGN